MKFAYDEPGTPRGSAAETSTEAPRSWKDDAACRGVDPKIFFRQETWGTALAICQTCEVVTECLDEGLRTRDRDTFRAGTTPAARDRIVRHARRLRSSNVRATCGTIGPQNVGGPGERELPGPADPGKGDQR